ncbi:MAG TPA: VOC family protein [Mycobacteriales bacterium]
MGVRWYSTVIDCRDVLAQGRWWARALGGKIVYEAPDEVVVVNQDETEPGLVFVLVPEAKELKNRLHIDLAPRSGDDQATEVDRLVGLGARQVDVGQGDASWAVLTDPEGNEFCVLTPRG